MTKYEKYVFYDIIAASHVLSHDRAVRATAKDIARKFSHFADLALITPVIVTKNGRERNVILSIDQYNNLMRRNRTAYRAEDTPDIFMKKIDNLIESLQED